MSTPVRFKSYRLILYSVLLGIILAAGALPTAAQEPEPIGPSRNLQREAPAREPVVLQSTIAKDGSVNTVIELPAEADSYIASNRPHQNFGADPLYLGYHYDPQVEYYGAERLLLRFDVLNSVPSTAVIHQASLQLWLYDSRPSEDTPMVSIVRRTVSSWNEFDVTWDTEPTWGEIRTTDSVSTTVGWYGWDLTELVVDWLEGDYPNYGIEIIGDEQVQQRERVFHSRETTTEYYPRLVINYTESSDTEPPVVTVDPLPEYSRRGFPVSWSGEDQGSSGIAYYDVQYRVNGGEWIDWLLGVDFTSANYSDGQDGQLYEFRARGVDHANNVEEFGEPEAWTIVDNKPPFSWINPLPAFAETSSFTVSWIGNDGEGSGIHYYDVQYRVGNGPWTLWQQQTIATSASFTAMADGVYAFEVRAVDNSGLTEAFLDQGEASIMVDLQAPFIEPRLWLPIVSDQLSLSLDDAGQASAERKTGE